MQINRLKRTNRSNGRDSKPRPRYKRRTRKRKHSVVNQESDQLSAIKIGVHPLEHEIHRQDSTPANREVSLDQLHALDSPSPTDTPTAQRTDPTYEPGDSPGSRRELQDT